MLGNRQAMQNAPAQNTDTIGRDVPVEIDAAVSALSRLLGEAAAQEWVARPNTSTEDTFHDQGKQDYSVIDGA